MHITEEAERRDGGEEENEGEEEDEERKAEETVSQVFILPGEKRGGHGGLDKRGEELLIAAVTDAWDGGGRWLLKSVTGKRGL